MQDIPVLDNPASYPSYTNSPQSGTWSEPYEASISGSLTTPSAVTVLPTAMPTATCASASYLKDTADPSAASMSEDASEILTIQTINPTAQAGDVQAARSASMVEQPAGDGKSDAGRKVVGLLAMLPFVWLL